MYEKINCALTVFIKNFKLSVRDDIHVWNYLPEKKKEKNFI